MAGLMLTPARWLALASPLFHSLLVSTVFAEKPVVDETGDIPIFRYGNKVVLVGPNAGTRDARENAYIFRVFIDRFYEVHGMLPDDTDREPPFGNA